MHTNNELVRYDEPIPNKNLLICLEILGWIGILAGAVLLALSMLQSVDAFGHLSEYGGRWMDGNWDGSFTPYPGTPLFVNWYYWVTILVAGIVLAGTIYGRYKHYFVEVLQGRIIGRDTYGGSLAPLEWDLTLEGNTRANELRQYTFRVSYGSLQDCKDGDIVDYR